jgi:hypothetical protein
LSLDLLLALIPITIMLGLVAANMGNIMYDTQDTIYRSSLERASADTVNTLLKTSGDPYNWENISSSQVKVVGLAKYDSNLQPIEYVLSPQKLGTLNASGPQAVQNIIGDQYGFYIVITPLNSSETVLWNLTSTGTSKDAAKDVVKVQRDVIYGGFDIVSTIKGATHDGGMPQNWNAKDPFPTNKYYNQIYDYYVLIIDRGITSASIVVNNHEVLSQNDFKGYDRNSNWTVPIPSSYLQNGTGFAYNNFAANFVASGGSMDVYVVQVPKGTPQDQVTYENARGQKYLFQFYAWTK